MTLQNGTGPNAPGPADSHLHGAAGSHLLPLLNVDAPIEFVEAEFRVHHKQLEFGVERDYEDIPALEGMLGPIGKRSGNTALSGHTELSVVVKDEVFDRGTRARDEAPVLDRVETWQARRIKVLDDFVRERSRQFRFGHLRGAGSDCELGGHRDEQQ